MCTSTASENAARGTRRPHRPRQRVSEHASHDGEPGVSAITGSGQWAPSSAREATPEASAQTRLIGARWWRPDNVVLSTRSLRSGGVDQNADCRFRRDQLRRRSTPDNAGSVCVEADRRAFCVAADERSGGAEVRTWLSAGRRGGRDPSAAETVQKAPADSRGGRPHVWTARSLRSGRSAWARSCGRRSCWGVRLRRP
jgi:hypothetical protein